MVFYSLAMNAAFYLCSFFPFYHFISFIFHLIDKRHASVMPAPDKNLYVNSYLIPDFFYVIQMVRCTVPVCMFFVYDRIFNHDNNQNQCDSDYCILFHQKTITMIKRFQALNFYYNLSYIRVLCSGC